MHRPEPLTASVVPRAGGAENCPVKPANGSPKPARPMGQIAFRPGCRGQTSSSGFDNHYASETPALCRRTAGSRIALPQAGTPP